MWRHRIFTNGKLLLLKQFLWLFSFYLRYQVSMPRKPIIRSNEHYYHLVARSNNKDFFSLPLSVVWHLMTNELSKLQEKFDLRISAFVLMNNHFHLLMMTPDKDIDWVMFYFMKDTTKKMQRELGRINRIYGSRYRGCLIENQHYLMNVYKYIYLNPIRAGLAARAEQYQFSTLNNNLNLPFKLDPVVPLSLQSHNRELECRWINETFSLEESSSIKTGLSKTEFCYSKNKTNRKEIVPRFNF